MLVSAGVDIDAPTHGNSTAVDAAIFRGIVCLSVCLSVCLCIYILCCVYILYAVFACDYVCMREGHLRVAQFLLGAGAKSKSSPVVPHQH